MRGQRRGAQDGAGIMGPDDVEEIKGKRPAGRGQPDDRAGKRRPQEPPKKK